MKDRWSQLSMSEKSDLMSLYIRNGISSLEEIKKHYNSYDNGGEVKNHPIPKYSPDIDDKEQRGYREYMWKLAQARRKAHLETYGRAASVQEYFDDFMTNSEGQYNYRRWYNLISPQERKEALNMGTAHWMDAYGKTAKHPGFSDESPYSGYVNPYNPKGIVGGKWVNDDYYELSDSQIDNDWDINRTLDEFKWSRENEGSSTHAYYKGARVLPELTVTPNGAEVRGYEFATGGQMNTDGPDDPEEDKIYTARPLNEVQIIGQRNPAQADVLQQHLDNVNSFYYNDVVPRLQREHQGLKTKPDINFPYLNIEDIDFKPTLLGKGKAAAYVNPIFPSKIHSYVNPESRYFNEDMAHENSHRWQFEHPKRDKQYKDKSKEMLRQAYGNFTNKFRNTYKSFPAFIMYGPNRNAINIEYEADNRAVRYNIWRDYRDLYHRTPTIEELDKYIDEMPEDRLYKYYIKPSGYLDIHSTVPKFGDRNFNDELEYFNENMKAIKEALKHVAQNNTTEDTVHYAALGGHLFKDGGTDGSKEDKNKKKPDEPPVRTYNIPMVQPMVSTIDQ